MPPYLCLRCFAEMVPFLGPQAQRTRYRDIPRLVEGRCPVCGGTQALDPRILERTASEETPTR